MKKSSYVIGVICILIVLLSFTVAALMKNNLTPFTFTFFYIIVPLSSVAIISFIDGLLNPEKLLKVIGFNIIIVLIIELITFFFAPVFSSKEFINRLNSMSQNSSVRIQPGKVSDVWTGLFIFILIVSLFSFIGSKIGNLIKKSTNKRGK